MDFDVLPSASQIVRNKRRLSPEYDIPRPLKRAHISFPEGITASNERPVAKGGMDLRTSAGPFPSGIAANNTAEDCSEPHVSIGSGSNRVGASDGKRVDSHVLTGSTLSHKHCSDEGEGRARPQMSIFPNGVTTNYEYSEGWTNSHPSIPMTSPQPGDLTAGNTLAGLTKPGFLENAQNVLLKNPSMIDIGTQNVFVNDPSSAALPWLGLHTMPGAEFDSLARDPPPRCHPATRTAIIQRVQNWLNDSDKKKKLLWLHGPAGVGKSAIVQTLVEAKSCHLGASLFFSRLNHLNKPEKVFPTIAYQLAVRDSSYKAHIAELMVTDPRSLEKAISEQFRRLIIEPFAKKGIRRGSKVWIIALDGLDECDGVGEEHSPTRLAPSRHSDDYQRKIIELISKFVLDYPSAPLVWIIASRPEPHLKAAFLQDTVVPTFWEEDIPVDSDEACRDVERYLQSEFEAIRRKYPDHISNETWPSNGKFLKIARTASGLFAFASVITLFVGDPWLANPVDQLDCALSVINKLSISCHPQNPLAALDALYTEILDRIPSNTLPVTKRLIAAGFFLNSHLTTLVFMCNVFGITQGAAIKALRHLHSVIKIPRNDKIEYLRIGFYHASFRDFLEDPSRSHEYAIDTEVVRGVRNEFWWGMFRILQHVATSNGLGSLSDTCLSWACKEHIKGRLVTDARIIWYCFLLGTFHENNYRFKYLRSEIQISASDVLSIVEKLDFKVLAHYPISSSHREIFAWLSQLVNHFPEELKRRGVLTYLAFSTLDIRKADYGQARYSVDPRTKDDTEHPPLDIDLMKCWVEFAPLMEIAIWGTGSRRCAVFEIAKVVDGTQRTFKCFLPGV